MSSITARRQNMEAWLVIVACGGFTLWYAKGQFLYSLYFGYQVARFFFPHWFPSLGGSGG